MSGYSGRLLHTILFLIFISIYGDAALAQAKQTLSCSRKDIKIDRNFYILNGKSTSSQPKLFLIKNNSKQGIWLNRYQNNNPHASAGWSSYLKPRHWSALLLSQNKFFMSCSTIKPGKVKYLNCANVIQVCESNMHLTSKQGNYWLVENKNWDEFIKEVFRKTNAH